MFSDDAAAMNLRVHVMMRHRANTAHIPNSRTEILKSKFEARPACRTIQRPSVRHAKSQLSRDRWKRHAIDATQLLSRDHWKRHAIVTWSDQDKTPNNVMV
eukprot:2790420-Amphidinium_carterae.1